MHTDINMDTEVELVFWGGGGWRGGGGGGGRGDCKKQIPLAHQTVGRHVRQGQ